MKWSLILPATPKPSSIFQTYLRLPLQHHLAVTRTLPPLPPPSNKGVTNRCNKLITSHGGHADSTCDPDLWPGRFTGGWEPRGVNRRGCRYFKKHYCSSRVGFIPLCIYYSLSRVSFNPVCIYYRLSRVGFTRYRPITFHIFKEGSHNHLQESGVQAEKFWIARRSHEPSSTLCVYYSLSTPTWPLDLLYHH